MRKRAKAHICHSIFSVPNRHGQGMAGAVEGREWRGRGWLWEQRIPFYMPQNSTHKYFDRGNGLSFLRKNRDDDEKWTKIRKCVLYGNGTMAQSIGAMRNTYVPYVCAPHTTDAISFSFCVLFRHLTSVDGLTVFFHWRKFSQNDQMEFRREGYALTI